MTLHKSLARGSKKVTKAGNRSQTINTRQLSPNTILEIPLQHTDSNSYWRRQKSLKPERLRKLLSKKMKIPQEPRIASSISKAGSRLQLQGILILRETLAHSLKLSKIRCLSVKNTHFKFQTGDQRWMRVFRNKGWKESKRQLLFRIVITLWDQKSESSYHLKNKQNLRTWSTKISTSFTYLKEPSRGKPR